MSIESWRTRRRLKALALAVGLPFAPLALLIAAVCAVLARADTTARRRRAAKPRLVYGPVPIISLRNMRQAMAQRGYEARTFVYEVYSIHSREDYDHLLEESFGLQCLKGLPRRAVAVLFGRYLAFCWLLFRFDVFHFFFDGGFLSGTPLQFLEVQLLHLAGKKVIVMPYGSDVAIPSHMRSLVWRHGLMCHYPHLGAHERETLRRVHYYSEHADFIVACVFHMETLPRWDLLTTLYYPIDTETWAPTGTCSPHNGKDGPVSVVHAPNHRVLKGTEFLIAACRELQAEGLQVHLRLLEGVPNTEVRRIVQESDILADQFVNAYALTAVEGMSVGKPVMANLSDESLYRAQRLYTGLDECPIVSTPIERIKDNLRALVLDPALRQRLGEQGRRYVLKYHSYEAMGRMWEAVYRKVWHGQAIDLHAWHPDRFESDRRHDSPVRT